VSAISPLHPRPTDATLTVTRAAHVLGVHPNTIRAWSDAGRLRYYRINPRGDRRYRLSDLNRFLAGAAEGPPVDELPVPHGRSLRHRAGRGSGRVDLRSVPAPEGGTSPAGAPAADGIARAAEGLAAIASLGRLAGSIAGAPVEPDAILATAARDIRDGGSFSHVSIWHLADDLLEPVATAGTTPIRLRAVPITDRRFAEVFAEPAGTDAEGAGPTSAGALGILTGLQGREVIRAIVGPAGPWGVLLVVDPVAHPASLADDIGDSAAQVLGSIVGAADATTKLERRIHRAEALGRVASDIGSRLDLEQLLARLVDHTIAMFGADRAAVFLYRPDGSREAVASRRLSASYIAALQPVGRGTLSDAAIAARRPLFVTNFRDDPRAAEVRAAVVQEGYDTVCVAPLLDDDGIEPLGSLNVYHNRPHRWSEDELATVGALATQAGVAIRSAHAYAQLSTWAAQLQSIQQLGARLNRLADVAAIGNAIASELNRLIDYHNVRVYRLVGDDLVPVAMRGQVGEYFDETPDQLRVKLGAGITGWVAEHRVAQNLGDAGADPRANTIPGTDADLDESMLLAPMLFDDEVLGVLVLSKLGLHQFTDDDLRLLVIYASFAAQAMAHADAMQRLQRQVQSQRDLLQITESILTTLDTGSVLESVADRLAELVGWDNVAIELWDAEAGVLVPVMAKGVDAAEYMQPWLPGESGLGPWVAINNEAVLLRDQFDDPRVFTGPQGPLHGGLICVPLRGRTGASGVLTLERLGEGRVFSDEEFELVKLFAAQVSIAVQNAEAHGAIARQAETDDLTGLSNHRSFRRALAAAVAEAEPFSLLMVDLDRFKLVNDTFGHQAGNDFLVKVAQAMVGASRGTDAVFRYGGDEFVVLLPRSDGSHAVPVAERIRRAISDVGASAGIDSGPVRADASAGVATYPADGDTADAILLSADRACFLAKRSGGGRVMTAGDAASLGGEFTLQVPTPIDSSP
jgi:diguanylate cyclase (GGDEF)-like protein/excisionase family DNA binding protein